jgi:predicted transcriptional regulator
VKALEKKGPEILVGEVMQREVVSVSPEDSLVDVQQLLSSGKSDVLPVVEGERFLGLITLRDLNEIYRLASTRLDLSRDEGAADVDAPLNTTNGSR